MFGEDKLNNENNTYKQKPIKKEIKQIKQSIKLLKNLSSESLAQKLVNQRKEQVRGQYWTDYKQWQVAEVALILPILGKSFNRDFSPLKSYLV
ncbi:MAG: IS200/IS605 family accessory protein TnpB-related protein, partial [Hydrogenothermaceae bacterium]